MRESGLTFEARVQRLMYFEGYLTRRDIALEPFFYPEKVTVTDLDVIGIGFSAPFRTETLVVDCKAGDAKVADRILRLRGLKEYLAADIAIFAKSSLGRRFKDLAEAVGLQAVDFKRLHEREQELGIGADEWYGSHHLQRTESMKKMVKECFRDDKFLLRLYWFLNGDFWYSDNYRRFKKLCSGLERIGQLWVERADTPRYRAFRWLLAESVILATVAITEMVANVYHLTEDEAKAVIEARLASGVARFEELRELTKRVNEYIRAVVTDVGGPGAAAGTPVLELEAPSYAKALIDLVMRLRSQPMVARDLARFEDVVLYEFVLQDQGWDETLLRRLGFSSFDALEKQMTNVVRFLAGGCGLKEEHVMAVLPKMRRGSSPVQESFTMEPTAPSHPCLGPQESR